MELSGPEAADALNISSDLFRKRLQVARVAVRSFTKGHCGLVSDAAACSCNRQVAGNMRSGRINPAQPAFADRASSFQESRAMVRQVDEARRAAAVHRTSQPRDSDVDFARRIVGMFDER